MALRFQFTPIGEKASQKFKAKATDGLEAIRLEMISWGNDFVKEISKEPGPVKYPIDWVSDEQRAWYFAKRKSLPYSRSGKVRRWKFDVRDPHGYLTIHVVSGVRYAKFVYGSSFQPEDQQPFHSKTGWPTLAGVRASSKFTNEALLRRVRTAMRRKIRSK